MDEARIYQILLLGFIAVALLTAAALLFITAPYGRHTAGRRWGPQIRSRLGWILMEAPSPIVFFLCFLLGDRRGAAALVFLLMWQAHYIHRAFIFPFRMRGGDKPMPLMIAGTGVLFNLINGYLNGRYLYTLGPAYPAEWLASPRFLLGLLLFCAGFAINQHADKVLLGLRRPGETGYKIPHGGLYHLISCPNYFGEILEWTGWAIATWSPAGLAFAIWTAANLAPRARSHHRFYRERFPDYPPGRRALIPFLF
jgi:hypothetical protein